MTVESTISRAQYDTNGTTGPWTVPFYFIANDHLEVIYTDADGNETILVLDVDFSVTGAGDSSGGTVTTTTAYAFGGQITILRSIQPLQETVFNDTDSFPAKAVERGLDLGMQLIQQLEEVVGRALVFAPSDEAGSQLPAVAARAGRLLGFDSEGRVNMNAPADGSASSLALLLASVLSYNEGAGMVGNAPFLASSRTVLKQVAAAVNSTVFLQEAGREGLFTWTAGDFSAHIAADTQEGIYVKANATAANLGAWVRRTPGDGEWHLDWFGVPADPASGNGGGTEVQAHTQLSTVINLGNIVKPGKITFGSKIYTLGAALPAIAWQVQLIGARGAQGTILVKRYVEASATRGVLSFGDFGFHIFDITIRATSGSGGSGISAVLTLNTPAAGRTFLVRTYVSGGDFFNYSLYVNGASNTTVSGPSYRGFWCEGGEYFGAAIAAIRLVSVNHWFGAGTFVTNAGGSSLVAMQIDGDASAYNDDIQFHGLLGGRVNMDYLSRAVFVTPQVDNIVVGSNVTKSMWVGHRWGGTLTNNATAGEFVFSYDAGVAASGGNSAAGWRKWGSGKIQQWGTVTTVAGVLANNVWPLAFTSSNINAAGNPIADPGANIVGNAQVIPQAGNTQYDVKCFNFNYSTGVYGGASAVVRWFADGI